MIGLLAVFFGGQNADKLGSALVPGTMSTVHGTIQDCNDCHVAQDEQKHWVLAAFDSVGTKESNAGCQACHATGNAVHSIASTTLEERTHRIKQDVDVNELNATFVSAPDFEGDGVPCSTCHKEHQGRQQDLTAMSDAQCQTCHVRKFESFAGNHPEFRGYPYSRPVSVIFDHDSHFKTHFSKTTIASKISCSTCHVPEEDGSAMLTRSFETTCSACHTDRITGRSLVSGPKAFAMITLPGLDLDRLDQANVPIGEWPDAAEGPVSPFFKMLLSKTVEGRSAIAAIDELNLNDLSKATENDVAAALDFVWLVKQWAQDFRDQGPASGQKKLLQGLTRETTVAFVQKVFPNLDEELATRTRGEHVLSRSIVPVGTPTKVQSTVTDTTAKTPVLSSEQISKIEKAVEEEWQLKLKGITSPADTNDLVSESVVGNPRNKSTWNVSSGWLLREQGLFYRPGKHADSLSRAWLELNSSDYPDIRSRLVVDVSKRFAAKDRPGQCSTCHAKGTAAGRMHGLGWKPSADQSPTLTYFDHAPHLTGLKLSCVDCHKSVGGEAFRKWYDETEKKPFQSNFNEITKKQCIDCHENSKAGETCTSCHRYHATPVEFISILDGIK